MQFNRRQFLISSAVFAAGCAGPTGNSPAGAGREHTVNAGPAAQYLKDGVYTNHLNQGFFLVRRGPSLFAVSAICTHRKCKLESRGDHTFYCPCHGSTFDQNGKVTSGPARRDLPVYQFSTDGQGNLLVTVSAG